MPTPVAWTCIVTITILSGSMPLMATKARLRGGRRRPLFRAQALMMAAFGFATAFALTCEAVTALPGLTRDQTFSVAFVACGVAVVLAFANLYLSVVRVPGMALVGVPIPRWLQRMAMQEGNRGGIRDSAEHRDD